MLRRLWQRERGEGRGTGKKGERDPGGFPSPKKEIAYSEEVRGASARKKGGDPKNKSRKRGGLRVLGGKKGVVITERKKKRGVQGSLLAKNQKGVYSGKRRNPGGLIGGQREIGKEENAPPTKGRGRKVIPQGEEAQKGHVLNPKNLGRGIVGKSKAKIDQKV